MAHPLHWIAEPLASNSSYIERAMFGCRACYLNGKLVLVLTLQSDPEWRGVLVPTERTFHPSLQLDFPQLVSHPILGKWLYLPESDPDFEELAAQMVAHILRGDERIGVEPKPRRTSSKSKRKKKKVVFMPRRKGKQKKGGR